MSKNEQCLIEWLSFGTHRVDLSSKAPTYPSTTCLSIPASTTSARAFSAAVVRHWTAPASLQPPISALYRSLHRTATRPTKRPKRRLRRLKRPRRDLSAAPVSYPSRKKGKKSNQESPPRFPLLSLRPPLPLPSPKSPNMQSFITSFPVFIKTVLLGFVIFQR